MNKKNFEPRLCIEASAGSGKTYNLAKRFLILLSMSNFNKQNGICRITKKSQTAKEFAAPNGLSSIVAITFTNKAAVEMKDRIVLFLKQLGSVYKNSGINNKEFGIEKKEALDLLVYTIKNHSDFNVATIDSFMNRIMRAFAVDLGINPNYDITFKNDDIFRFAVDELLNDASNRNFLLDFLNSQLLLDTDGINGEKIVEKGIKKIMNIAHYNKTNAADFYTLLYDFGNLFDTHIESFSDLRSFVDGLIKTSSKNIDLIIQKNENNFHGSKIKSYKGITLESIPKKIENYLSLISEDSIDSLLKKNKYIDIGDASAFFDEINKIVDVYKYYVILKKTYEYESVSWVFEKYKQIEKGIKKYLNVVDIGEIANSISSVLNDSGASYAFCKLGEKISHYMIDEFQDTSHKQFNAMYPLLENAVSEGGSLFVVGDRKQAIYAWREGDYRIFDRVLKDDYLHVMPETINTNFRSRKTVVEFNNKVFCNTGEFFDSESIKKLFGKKEKFAQYIKEDLEKIYRNAKQESKSTKNGYVDVIIKEFEDKDELHEFYKERMLGILRKLIYEKKIALSDIMILLRTKKQIETVVEWIREEFEDLDIIAEDSLNLINSFEIKKLLLAASCAAYRDDLSYKKAVEEIGLDVDCGKIEKQMRYLSPYEFFLYLADVCKLDIENNRLYFVTFFDEILKLSSEKNSIEDIINYFLENENISINPPKNINAVRVMTIHKSKGLQSQTVIMPFYDWKIYDSKAEIYDYFNIQKITGKNEYIFAQADKELRSVLDDAESKYIEKIKIDFVEAYNLMYVANTRAQDNLFIIGGFEKNRDGEYKLSGLNASVVLYESLKDDMQAEDGLYCYKNGSVVVPKPNIVEKEDMNDKKQIKFVSLARDYLKIYPQIYDVSINPKNRELGDLYHLAMSFVGKIEKRDDVFKMAQNAYKKAVSVVGYKDDMALKYIKNTLENLREYFVDIDEFWNEKELVDSDGRILRIDRLVKKNDKLFVIDYKTGKPDNKHKEQVKTYIELFGSASGIIYYASSGRVKYVN